MHLGHAKYFQAVLANGLEAVRNASGVDRIVGLEADVEQEVEFAVGGEDPNVPDPDAFLSVRIRTAIQWFRDPQRYSVCLWKEKARVGRGSAFILRHS